MSFRVSEDVQCSGGGWMWDYRIYSTFTRLDDADPSDPDCKFMKIKLIVVGLFLFYFFDLFEFDCKLSSRVITVVSLKCLWSGLALIMTFPFTFQLQHVSLRSHIVIAYLPFSCSCSCRHTDYTYSSSYTEYS